MASSSECFETRKQDLVTYSRAHFAELSGSSAIFHHLLLLAEGDAVREDIILDVCDFIDARIDCSDFRLHALIRLLYQFPDKLSDTLIERVHQTVLGFKYWPDEPGVDSLCTWTENHHILYAAGAYVLGQLFPDKTFINSGHTGRQKMEIARPRILRWLDLRFRTGFSEWLSNVYYDEDLVALMSLVDFCEDTDIQRRAEMATHLMLFDIAVNSFQGVFGSTHGRSYEHQKKWANRDNLACTQRLLFGTGEFPTSLNLSAPCFALSPHYRVPDVLPEIAHDPGTYTNRQRMGIKLAEAGRWDLGFDNFEDGMTFLSLEAYLHPRTANLTLRMFDAFNWWENDFFKDIAKYRNFITGLRRTGLLSLLMRLVERDVCRNTREQVNVITHRTEHFMLSSAVDYRPGYGGDQQHIWQATLGPDAVCFTAHPAKREKPPPDYWTGEGTLPRVAQQENVLLAIYNINTTPGLYVTNRLLFTHAWLPKDKFDEVLEREGWIFARRNEGYLALRSRNPYRWHIEPGEGVAREIIAEGKTNIWLCETGSSETWDTFAAFVDAICAAPVQFQGLNVTYDSPSQGQLSFGWRGPFTYNDQVVSLREFPRYDNPFSSTDFAAEHITIEHGEHRLEMDWED